MISTQRPEPAACFSEYCVDQFSVLLLFGLTVEENHPRRWALEKEVIFSFSVCSCPPTIANWAIMTNAAITRGFSKPSSEATEKDTSGEIFNLASYHREAGLENAIRIQCKAVVSCPSTPNRTFLNSGCTDFSPCIHSDRRQALLIDRQLDDRAQAGAWTGKSSNPHSNFTMWRYHSGSQEGREEAPLQYFLDWTGDCLKCQF